MTEINDDHTPKVESAEDFVHHAVLYRDVETATGIFALENAVRLVLNSMENGDELDSRRLDELLAMSEPQPQIIHDVVDGVVVVKDADGNIIEN